ncbi:MAG: S41 family peptidase [Planctomycetota bacterium]|nr:MAG: S41 family peptidase [Planctomycetota bacterium]
MSIRPMLSLPLLAAVSALLASPRPLESNAPAAVGGFAATSSASAQDPSLPGSSQSGSSQDGAALDALLAAQVAAAAQRNAGELAEQALGLRDLAGGSPSGDAALDAALDRRLAEVAAGGADVAPQVRLFLTTCRLQGLDPDAATLVKTLAPVLAATQPDLRAQAIALCASPAFKRLAPEARKDLVVRLLELSADAALEPELRIAASKSAFSIGSGQQRRDARKLMLEFSTSGEPSLQSLGALALADSGDDISGQLREKLQRIALAPGERGELARAHLRNAETLRALERKYRQLEDKDSGQLPPELAEIQAVMEMVHAEHLFGDKFDDEILLDAALDGMLGVLDEHSTYMDPKQFKQFNQELEAEYGGIGAYVGIDPDDDIFSITRPIYSGPAYKAGLQTDDKIVRIDNWPTLGKEQDEIIKRLKGKPGTPVRLYIWQRGMDPGLIERPTEEMAIDITRAQIAIPAVSAQMLPGNIGMVELKEFSRVASSSLRKSLTELQAQGMTALILDLRRNSGGLLNEAVNVASLFLPRGKVITSTDSRVQPSQRYRSSGEMLVPDEIPIVILTSRFTASAAEIVSGALQDHKRAELVGERTFGKGSVQNLRPIAGFPEEPFEDENRNEQWDNWEKFEDKNGNGEFDFGPRVKLTIAQYLLPSGRSIHKQIDRDRNVIFEGGIKPDHAVALERGESWKYEERLRIARLEKLPRDWVDQHWATHRELLRTLAVFDANDPNRYPDFDAFYAKCNTPLSQDDVRELLRGEVRRRVQDDRGAEFPLGDFEDDRQVQAGVKVVLEKLGRKTTDVPEYAATITQDPLEKGASDKLVADVRSHLSGQQSEKVRQALIQELPKLQEMLSAANLDPSKLSGADLETLAAFLAKLKSAEGTPDK